MGRIKNRFRISQYAGNGSLQLVSYVLCQLATYLLFFLQLFFCDALIETSCKVIEQGSQSYHHYQRELQQMPVARLAEGLNPFAVIVLEQDERGAIDDEYSHHAEPHLMTFR